MASGVHHYCEAERLIAEANHVGHTDPQRGDGMIAAAQVHATLALAAATALLGAFSATCLEDGIEDDTLTEWYEAASQTSSGGES